MPRRGAIAGADGFKKGWLAALDLGGGNAGVEKFETFDKLLAYPNLELVIVDIPIGLLDSGTRRADQAAREILKGRACCVFTAPIRPILSCSTQAEASTIWRSIEGKGCSAQTWAMTKKFVAPVDKILRERTRRKPLVCEGHPEVSFALMDEAGPIRSSKHTPEGRVERLKRLVKHFDRQVQAEIDGHPKYARSDVLDAFAMLWTARRVWKQEAHRFPKVSCEVDSFGFQPVILA